MLILHIGVVLDLLFKGIFKGSVVYYFLRQHHQDVQVPVGLDGSHV